MHLASIMIGSRGSNDVIRLFLSSASLCTLISSFLQWTRFLHKTGKIFRKLQNYYIRLSYPARRRTSFLLLCVLSSLQSCLTLCDPMDCSLPGFSVHGILQARILEWVSISSSRRTSQPRDLHLLSSALAGRFFMAPHSSTLAWKIPMEEPGGLQSVGSLGVGHN